MEKEKLQKAIVRIQDKRIKGWQLSIEEESLLAIMEYLLNNL